MSQCSQNTYEFIKSTFGPKIAAVCSTGAESICLQNGLSVVELLKPFSQLNTEFQIRDPTNTPHIIKGLHLSFSNPFKATESSPVVRKAMNDEISNNYTPGNVGVNVKGYYVKQSCPWYEAFRDMYFQHFKTAEHDSIMHYLACVIFVSATEEGPVAKFQALTEEIMKAPIKWVEPEIMCYHVLVYDQNKTPKTRVESIMESICTLYGPATCHLLRLHENEGGGGAPPGPNPWRQFAKDRANQEWEADPTALTLLQMAIEDEGDSDPLGATSMDGDNMGDNPMLSDNSGRQCGENLTISDQSAIRTCITDFVVRGLLPFNEKRMRTLHEALNARRGLRGTFFSATKKLFSAGPKPGASGKMTNNPGYHTDSPEILLRRLGDISFLLQHYTMAYYSYHSVKRDFQNDQAYNHYAAALEMTSLSVFMGTAVRREPYPYYDECINVYMNLCKAPLYAMRATLVHCECLLNRGYFVSAASWFIKLTNDEADLNSGLLLEQGAHCYVRMDPPSLRKYAFHLVLAGHRYSKAGQRKHALRCYRSAWDIFKDKGWSLAENHIGFTIGRHSYHIRDIDGAYSAYEALLTHDESAAHVMNSQILFQKGIQDFVSVVQIYLQKQAHGTTVELPVPVVDHNNINVTLFGEKFAGLVKQTPVFDKERRSKVQYLETKAHELQGKTSAYFKHHQVLFNGHTPNTILPTCAINETITVLIPLKNPLQIPITLSNLYLHCLHCTRDPHETLKTIKTPSRGSSPDLSFKTKQKNARSDQVETSQLEQLVMGPEEDVTISLSVTPLVEGNLTIAGLNYHLVSTKAMETKSPDGTAANPMENMVPGRISLSPQGPRLNSTKEQRVGEVYGPDNRLNLFVTSPLPRLQLTTASVPTHLFCGEIKCGVVEATNIGSTPLANLSISTSHSQLIAIGEVRLEPFTPVVHPIGGEYCSVINAKHKSEQATKLQIPGNVLNPGQTAYIAIWVHGGDEPDTINLLTVLYYQPTSTILGVTHRIVSSETTLNISVSVTVESQVCTMQPSQDNELELIGSVVVNNMGYYSLSLQELMVTQMSLISDRWILQSLDTNIPLVVYPGASINIPFKAQLANKQETYLSSVGLDGTPLIDCSQDHVLDMYRKSSSCILANKDDGGDAPAYNMGMIVFWEGSVSEKMNRTRTLHAQQHTALTAKISYDKPQLLCLGLSYQETWTTDFTTKPLLKVDVTLHITNCHSASLNVVVTANTTAGRTEQQNTLPFMWVGMVQHKVEIGNHTTASVHLTAVFSQPGLYNINQISVGVEKGGQIVPQLLAPPSLLRVDAL